MTKVFTLLPRLFLGLTLASGILASCTDVDKTLGVDMLPNDEQQLLVTDTIYPDAFTRSMDSIFTNSSPVMLVGSHFDPMFGLTSAGCTFQLLPTVDTTKFGTSPACDSLVLQLVVSGREKNANNALQTISVYELNKPVSLGSAYYPVTPAASMANSSPEATYSYDGKADTVRIRLSQALGARLLSASKSTMTWGDSIVNSPFLDYMMGFYITGTSTSGNERMSYFSPNVRMTLYYHNNENTDTTCVYSPFVASSRLYTVLFNTTTHDYSRANPAQKMQHLNDTTAAGLDSVLYAEGFYGATPFVKISSAKLKSWLQKINLTASQAAIVRAELVMETQEFSGFDMAAYPTSLGGITLLNTVTAGPNGYYYAGFLPSFYYYPSIFDGNLNGTHKKYSFNVTHELLSQLRQGRDLSFYLAPYSSNGKSGSSLMYYLTSSQLVPYKAVLKGPKNSRPLKLIITYAKPK